VALRPARASSWLASSCRAVDVDHLAVIFEAGWAYVSAGRHVQPDPAAIDGSSPAVEWPPRAIITSTMSRTDKRARRIAEHLEWLKAQGRTEVQDLGESTTGTTFLYSGESRPTETMQMVGEVASDRDRQWFEEHPQADYRVRWSLPGEFPTDDLQTTTGRPLDLEAGRFVVVVLQEAPGVRRRDPLLFVDGGPQTDPIPPEAWPMFHRAAQAPDREAAVRELAARLLDG
jgi:hypothetical protein